MYRKSIGYRVPKDMDLGSDAERVRKEEQKKVDEADQLTEEELLEKDDLLKVCHPDSSYSAQVFSVEIGYPCFLLGSHSLHCL